MARADHLGEAISGVSTTRLFASRRAIAQREEHMSVEENKTLVRRYFEDAPYNPDACDEIFAPVFRFHTIQHATINPDVDSSPQSEKAAYEWLRTVWGDWRATIDELKTENGCKNL